MYKMNHNTSRRKKPRTKLSRTKTRNQISRSFPASSRKKPRFGGFKKKISPAKNKPKTSRKKRSNPKHKEKIVAISVPGQKGIAYVKQ